MSLTIYTKPDCPYCEKAINFYIDQGTPYDVSNAQDDLAAREEMLTLTGGDPTVPVTARDGQLIEIGWEGRG